MSMQWEYQGVDRIRMQRKVSLAVQVVDDFTGLPVTSADVRVKVDQILAAPVRKNDGYFIFMDSPEQVLDVRVSSWSYYPTSLRVDLSQLTRLNPVVRIRLTPNRTCRIPMQTTCLEGRAPVGSTVQMYCENDPRPMRLLYDYQRDGRENGRFIQLFDPNQSDPVGRSYILLRKDDDSHEYITVSSAVEGDEGGYLMIAPLERDCKKAGTTLIPLMTVQVEEDGSFFLPIRAMAVKRYQCRISCTGHDGVVHSCSLELEAGKVTKIDLTGENERSIHEK